VASLWGPAAGAEADGPDHYRVHDVAAGAVLNLRAEPSTSAKVLARIPAATGCLRNLGCKGGLSFQEFTTLSEVQQRQRTRESPRWCRVDYQGTTGWAAGRYLAEDGCAAPPVSPAKP
jgi:SH3-like domain-containing protein